MNDEPMQHGFDGERFRLVSRLAPLGVLVCAALGCVSDYSPDAFDQPTLDAAIMRMDAASDARVLSEAAVQRVPNAGPCDLSGTWLMTERMVSSGLGAEQIINNWHFIEITQQGNKLTFAQSISCGTRVRGLEPFPVNMDDSKSWPAYMKHTSYKGRSGTANAVADGCQISVDKATLVRAATVDTYRDLSVALPKADQPAANGQPGWEDWDGDGKPGITARVNGTVSGTIYLASRSWTEYTGKIAANADSFTLPMQWLQERSTLGIDGPQLLASEVGRAPDASKHFVELARLWIEDFSADDAGKCQTVRELAPTLTPQAMK